MIGRSLQASQEGIEQARKALHAKSLNQTSLAEDLKISRATVSKFFAGKSVDRKLFGDICEKLGFEWEDIVTKPDTQPQAKANPDNSIDIDAIVQEVREKIKPLIKERCGTMRVLDMTQPIGLNDIYTSVNILEKITGQQRKEIAQLLQQCTIEDFERIGLGIIAEKRVPGLEAVEKYSKLMILGKPGAGKTTFLKYLAIQCIAGKFQSEHVPIFVTLKDFAEAANRPGLLEYLTKNTIKNISKKPPFVEVEITCYIQDVINHGKALVLLDGLDEVREEDNSRILKEISEFSERFRENHFVMTCRIAAREYTFDKFTEVEVADFDEKQIAAFTISWFKNKAVKPEIFLKRIEENNRIKQLATNPLLLTLLCLAFEESGDFPANRSELYKEGLDALLKKWDAKRGIQRDQVYKKLSVQRKEDLLSKIALTTFERGDYFFKQKIAEQYITEYIRNFPDANTDREALQLDSEEVLRSIEHHHGLVVARAKGIYSFSHLTFHEYFTAREFVIVKQSSEEALQSLVSHITEKRWREVFLLAVGMSSSADRLLLSMKEQVDKLVIYDTKLDQFLTWASEKSHSVDVPYKPAAIRVLYLGLVFDTEWNTGTSQKFAFNFANAVDVAVSVGRAFPLDFALDRSFIQQLDYQRISLPEKNLNFELTLELEPKLRYRLQQLKNQISHTDENILKQWWLKNGYVWTEELRAVIIRYRNIGHDWQFTDKQKELLKQYYNANKLLVECLNSDCYVSREVRQYIEDTLLLPIAEIEKRQQHS